MAQYLRITPRYGMDMPYTTNPHLPRLRLEAARLVLNEGWSTREVARHTGFNQSSIFEKDELADIRTSLLQLHQEKMKQEDSQRDYIHAEHKQVVKDIGDQLATLKVAEDMGIGDIAQASLQKLVDRREELQSKLNQTHQEGSAWIEKVIRSFELLKMAEEMLKHGSPHVREAILKAICSNYSVVDEKLVLDLRSPFKEASSRTDSPIWWTILDSNQ